MRGEHREGGGVRDNVFESRFMSSEIEHIPPMMYFTHPIANGHCIDRFLHKLIPVSQAIKTVAAYPRDPLF